MSPNKPFTPDTRLERLARRQELRKSDSYIIEPIFPTGAIHCISGPPDIGKSTWTFQLMHAFDQGYPVLGGLKCHKCEWVYVALDRGLRDTDRTLQRLGYGDWDAPVYSHEEIVGRTISGTIEKEPNIFDITKAFPSAKLLVIEGLQGYLPNTGRGQSLNKSQTMWVMQVRDQILNRGITIIAVTHTPKSSTPSHDREDMLGSQGLIGGLGTVVKFDMPRDADGKVMGMLGQDQTDSRLVTIMPKNSKRMFLNYSRGENGRFELDSKQEGTLPGPRTEENPKLFETASDKMRIMDAYLGTCSPQSEIGRKTINEWARTAGLSPAELGAWTNKAGAEGRLLREGSGKYRRSGNVN